MKKGRAGTEKGARMPVIRLRGWRSECPEISAAPADREVYVLGLSIWKIAIIGGIVVLLFGKGKISEMMSDMAKGIKSFKRGMAEDDEPKAIDQQQAETVAAPAEKKASG
jgi:sec-independent protein translocase protein TatA